MLKNSDRKIRESSYQSFLVLPRFTGFKCVDSGMQFYQKQISEGLQHGVEMLK